VTVLTLHTFSFSISVIIWVVEIVKNSIYFSVFLKVASLPNGLIQTIIKVYLLLINIYLIFFYYLYVFSNTPIIN